MKILVLASSYPRFPGDGAAPFVRSICDELAKQGHRIEVVAPFDELVQPSHDSLVKVHRFRYAPIASWHILGHARSLAGDMTLKPAVFLLLPFFLVSQFFVGLRLARRMQCDLIYAHWVVPSGLVGLGLSLVLKLPLALSLHGSDMFVSTRHRAFGIVAGRVLRHASTITACSPRHAKDAVRLGARESSVHLTPWGADPTLFSPHNVRPNRMGFGLSENRLILACLGRLVPKKGFDVLVRAMPQIIQSVPDALLVIAGEGSQRADLQRAVDDLHIGDHVQLLGSLPWSAVPQFLASADVFVMPSVTDTSGNEDGLPTVLLEAMSMALPVLATETGGIPLAIEDGVTGLLCSQSSETELAANAIRLLSNPDLRHELGTQARASVLRQHNWADVAQRLATWFAGSSAASDSG